ncbi:hypothetical protein [Paenibacillus hunanensis]|uniref:Uncharacterized protein n=1 Tax=Paenibacillus hunanensis TaxID=539262 RepID=A0ABU1IW77_9BACL|nr:hypothetical protein [Paenibacillus hunanensis]MDR6243493.1 hypothetical protein [Paenibacillus hunanensis]GGI98159.1 hypothetical protein GCM10008022_03550 [Paenibacillus hunanensis]
MKYRYYYKKDTRKCLQTVRRLIESGRIRISDIVTIRGNFNDHKWYRLTIRTKTEQLQFTGLSWFYFGTGSLGLQQVLRWLLVPSAYQKAVLDVKYQGDTYQPNCFVICFEK